MPTFTTTLLQSGKNMVAIEEEHVRAVTEAKVVATRERGIAKIVDGLRG